MNLGITGKRALIIGGSSGLGLAAAQALAAEGVDIATFARNSEVLTSVSDDIKANHGVDAQGFSGDITVQADVQALRDWVETTGGINILVLNTPRPPSPMRDFLDEDDDLRWNDAYTNQLQCALYVLRHLTPLLLNKGWGRIIGVTSASIKQPMPRHAVSSIFRAGVQTALKHLVEEVAPHGITVNAIAPATVMTPTFAQFHNLERRVSGTALKRAGTLDEFGGTVAFLASQQAGFITGENIQFDGGMTKSLL
ncbi:SDR family oxidoreductase [Phaeobacter sp. CAU 1743]|uniref:SDR family oxidoreductase n=1 Tax=Phaeobacter sp. CAU 1743 TaxID=3140367 RepID=UPI0023B3A9BC